MENHREQLSLELQQAQEKIARLQHALLECGRVVANRESGLFDADPDALLLFDRDGVVVQYRPAEEGELAAALGPGDALGLSIQELFPGPAAELTRTAAARTRESGRTVRLNLDLALLDGRKLPVVGWLRGLPNGQITLALRDSPAASAQAGDSLFSAREILTPAGLCMLALDTSSGALSLGDDFYALLGAQRQNGAALPIETFMRRFVFSADIAVFGAALRRALEVPTEEYGAPVPLRLLRADNTPLQTSMRCRSPKDEQGRAPRMLALFDSRPAPVPQSAPLRPILDCLPGPAYYKDARGAYIACNHAFEVLAGRPEGQIVRLRNPDLFPPQTVSAFEELEGAALAQKSFRAMQIWADLHGGRRVLLEITAAPYFSPEGDLLGIAGWARDPAERARSEQDRLVGDICARIEATTTVEDALRVAVRELAQALGAEHASVTYDPDAG